MIDRRDPQTYAIIGAAMEVHGELGCGFLEAVFQEALENELAERSIPFVSQVMLPVFYKGRQMKARYRADLICFGRVVVELKAISQLTAHDDAQLINYLKATRQTVGLLLNFGTRSLEHRRKVYGLVDTDQTEDPF